MSYRWSDVGFCTVRQSVEIKALVPKRTFASTLVKVLAVLDAQRFFVVRDEFLLLFLGVDPVHTGANEIRGDSALGTSADDLIVELLSLTPFPYASQAEAVIAVWKYPESLFPRRLLHYRLETNAARFLPASLNSEG